VFVDADRSCMVPSSYVLPWSEFAMLDEKSSLS
jgi:hypothetical protein